MGKSVGFSRRIASLGLCAAMFASMLVYLPSSVFRAITAKADHAVAPFAIPSPKRNVSTAAELSEDLALLEDGTLDRLELTLTDGITVDSGINVPSGRELIINLNGKSLTGSSQLFNVDGTLTINGGTLSVTNSYSQMVSVMWIYSGAKVTIENTIIYATGSPVAFFNSGTLEFASSTQVVRHHCTAKSTPSVAGTVYNSGTFTMSDGSSYLNRGSLGLELSIPLLYNTSTGVFNANGGTIGAYYSDTITNEGTIQNTTTQTTDIFAIVSNKKGGKINGGKYSVLVNNSSGGIIGGGEFSAVSGAFLVSFSTNGGSADPAPQWRCNAPITVPTTPEKEGYTFTGWYSNGTQWDTKANVTSNLSLVAGWEDTIVRDTQTPTISGIANNGNYCNSAAFTVSDNVGVASVTINGETATAVDGKYTIDSASVKQTIVVTDLSGNITVYSVWVHPKHKNNTSGVCEYCEQKDTTPPVIQGLVNAKDYCGTVDFTVTDDSEGAVSVTVDGTPLADKNGVYTLTASTAKQSVVAKDAAGNTTTCQVTVHAKHKNRVIKPVCCEYCGKTDKTPPVVTGLEQGGAYCGSVEFTVTDDSEVYVVAHIGVQNRQITPVDGVYSVKANAVFGTQASIAISDGMDGNAVTYTISLYATHTYENGKCKICGEEDKEAPTISGIANNGEYCDSAAFTVSDNVGVASVTINGETATAVDGKYTIVSANIKQTVVVTDDFGNVTVCSVWVHPKHSYNSSGVCTVCGEGDSTSPVIAGIVNNGEYCGNVEFTVTDESTMQSVTANGDPLTASDGVYSLSAGENDAVTIVATDANGNSTTCTIQLYASHTYENGKCKICGEEDKEAPTISGIVNNGEYCISAAFTVSDNVGVASVTINGETATAVDGQYTINPFCQHQATVVATDLSGNTTIYYVTVREKHTKGNDGRCSKCGDFIDGVTAHPVGYTLSLNGNIGVNFYMELASCVTDDPNAYMHFTLPDGTAKDVKVASAPTDITLKSGTTYYIFSCEVAAQDMYETITAKLVLSNGSDSEEYTFKVEDYANYILDETNGYNQQTRKLVSAMLSYGNYAKAYFNDDELVETSEIAAVTAENLDSYAHEISGTLPDGITYCGSTLLLESETAVRHYFKVADGTDVPDSMIQQGDYYYIQTESIAADQLGIAVRTVINDCTISYSPMSYARAVLNSDSVDNSLKNLIKAFYLYHQAALGYKIS